MVLEIVAALPTSALTSRLVGPSVQGLLNACVPLGPSAAVACLFPGLLLLVFAVSWGHASDMLQATNPPPYITPSGVPPLRFGVGGFIAKMFIPRAAMSVPILIAHVLHEKLSADMFPWDPGWGAWP